MSFGVPGGWFERTRTRAGMKSLLHERSQRARSGHRPGRRQRVVVTTVFAALIAAGILANLLVQAS